MEFSLCTMQWGGFTAWYALYGALTMQTMQWGGCSVHCALYSVDYADYAVRWGGWRTGEPIVLSHADPALPTHRRTQTSKRNFNNLQRDLEYLDQFSQRWSIFVVHSSYSTHLDLKWYSLQKVHFDFDKLQYVFFAMTRYSSIQYLYQMTGSQRRGPF